MLILNEIKLNLGEPESHISAEILAKLRLDSKKWNVRQWKILERSIDARDKKNIRPVFKVAITVSRSDNTKVNEQKLADYAKRRGYKLTVVKQSEWDNLELKNDFFSNLNPGGIQIGSHLKRNKRPVIVGLGPCGIFAAYVLAGAGLRPIVLERGEPVELRSARVKRFWEHGELDEDSNVLFGEGGAGTFSDGKLTTGTNDARKNLVIRLLAEMSGISDLTEYKRPHVGTDKLRIALKNLRKQIEEWGGEIKFSSKLTYVISDKNHRLTKIGYVTTKQVSANDTDLISKNEEHEIETKTLILAIGHSARDTIAMLHDAGLNMEQKPFSMGVRVEHLQSFIDESQYGSNFNNIYGMSVREAGLPPAEYKLSFKADDGRGVYSFCMCPGGEVISCATEFGMVFTNGMSYRARDGLYANSAILVDVRPSDFMSSHPLAGIEMQRAAERKAFKAFSMNCDKDYSLTKESFKDFALSTAEHASIMNSTQNDLSLADCLPEFVSKDIVSAMRFFDKKIPGFGADGISVYGPETRSSSPVRIKRGESMQSNIVGIYPCGEGAGYAGGIVSAAVDGIKAAETIIALFLSNE